jgi:hypothetical protein
VEEVAKIQIKVMGNLYNETIAENFSALCSDTDNHEQKAFWTPNRHDQEKTLHVIS